MYVLIPTHNRKKLLIRTIQSLIECEFPETYKGTYVIENGSSVGVADEIVKLPDEFKIRYIHQEEGNKSKALNSIIEKLDKGLIVFFDDDIRIERNTLVEYEKAYKKHGLGFYYGGPFGVDYEKEPDEALMSYLPASARGSEFSGFSDRTIFLGFNWAASVSDIKDCGMFHPQIGPGTSTIGQETYMMKQMLSREIKPVLVPGARVWHYVPVVRSNKTFVLSRSFRKGQTIGNGIRAAGGILVQYYRLFENVFYYIIVQIKRTLFLQQPVFHFYWTREKIKGILKGFYK